MLDPMPEWRGRYTGGFANASQKTFSIEQNTLEKPVFPALPGLWGDFSLDMATICHRNLRQSLVFDDDRDNDRNNEIGSEADHPYYPGTIDIHRCPDHCRISISVLIITPQVGLDPIACGCFHLIIYFHDDRSFSQFRTPKGENRNYEDATPTLILFTNRPSGAGPGYGFDYHPAGRYGHWRAPGIAAGSWIGG